MRAKDGDLLFEACIKPGGSISIPPEEARKLRAGQRVVVRVQSAPLARELAARGIREEEIHLIADTQLESRERVVRFLLAEGALKVARRKRRVGGGSR